MFKMRFRSALILGLIAVAAAGCKKSETKPAEQPTAKPDAASATANAPVARIHWLGIKQITAGSNAPQVAEIWKLPESAKLEAQTLEKLSLAPWGLQRGSATPTNPPTALLRALLDDVVQEESYLEVRAAAGQPGEI